MRSILVNILVCTIFEVFAGLMIPEGKMQKIVLSIIGIYLFFVMISPVINFIQSEFI